VSFPAAPERFAKAMFRALPMQLASIGVALCAVLLLAGCSDDVVSPGHAGFPPETEITFAPAQYDTVSFRVHFYWSGSDRDGAVVAFRWIVDPDDSAERFPRTWRRTTAHDTTLVLQVDPITATKQHVFMIAAEDNDGRLDPTPAVRYFSAITVPPTSWIAKGPRGYGSLVGPNLTFEVQGVDPDGGMTVGPAPVDSFQYLLLKLGALADTSTAPPVWHLPLPATYDVAYFTNLITRAEGDSLPYPHGDWRWIGVRGTTIRFEAVEPGGYVFVVRAVDQAGAVEKGIVAGVTAMAAHLRYIVVPEPPVVPRYPVLSIMASSLLGQLSYATYAIGPVDFPRVPIEIFEGGSISFSWSGNASGYGGEVIGYDVAFDDPGSLGNNPDPRLTGITLGPDRLTPGSHFLYLYCIDSGGGNTLAAIPILVVHPAFLDPGAAREILLVDDSLSPGDYIGALGSFPSDATETAWYLEGDPSRPGEARIPRILNAFPGVTVTEWDTKLKGVGVEGRNPPALRDLATISTVIWMADFNNTTSAPIALWKTLVGGSQNALGDYLRAGGTLIITGYNVVNNSTSPSTLLVNRTAGLCGSFAPGSREWALSWFPRLVLGVDWVVPSEDGRRALGARDFVAAYPTDEGAGLGFDTAFVDTGITGTGAKWDTNSDIAGTASYMDLNLTPGLPRIEGWNMASSFGCAGDQAFWREDPGVPIARPIYRYHGVDRGVNQTLGPSPREGRVVGVLCQAHDLGPVGDAYGGPPGDRVGRVVVLDIPLYFLRNQQASDILFSAFTYVNGSPTLP
jgi:hypothetical protein